MEIVVPFPTQGQEDFQFANLDLVVVPFPMDDKNVVLLANSGWVAGVPFLSDQKVAVQVAFADSVFVLVALIDDADTSLANGDFVVDLVVARIGQVDVLQAMDDWKVVLPTIGQHAVQLARVNQVVSLSAMIDRAVVLLATVDQAVVHAANNDKVAAEHATMNLVVLLPPNIGEAVVVVATADTVVVQSAMIVYLVGFLSTTVGQAVDRSAIADAENVRFAKMDRVAGQFEGWAGFLALFAGSADLQR